MAELFSKFKDGNPDQKSLLRAFYQAQRRIEKRHELQRIELVKRIQERREMLHKMGQHANLDAL